jgi:hypothetical protein
MAGPTVVLVTALAVAVRKGLLTAALRRVSAMAVLTVELTAVPKGLRPAARIPARPTVEPTAARPGVPEVGDYTAGGRAASGRATVGWTPGSPALCDR